MNLIELNKFSFLHDGKNIFFCKTDYLLDDFKQISTLENDVVLISGNSDYPITDDLVRLLPKNVKYWFAQNVISKDERLIPIPIGLENKNVSFREGHGIGYFDRATTKEILLTRNNEKKPIKKIYSNFKIETNFHHRFPVMETCKTSEFIFWEDPTLSLESFFDNILDYEAVVCPAGNGVDTHRLWEVLYSKRIPITIQVGDFKIYELYQKLPIVILNSIEELKNEKLISDKIQEINKINHNYEILDCDYWIEKIKNLITW